MKLTITILTATVSLTLFSACDRTENGQPQSTTQSDSGETSKPSAEKAAAEKVAAEKAAAEKAAAEKVAAEKAAAEKVAAEKAAAEKAAAEKAAAEKAAAEKAAAEKAAANTDEDSPTLSGESYSEWQKSFDVFLKQVRKEVNGDEPIDMESKYKDEIIIVEGKIEEIKIEPERERIAVKLASIDEGFDVSIKTDFYRNISSYSDKESKSQWATVKAGDNVKVIGRIYHAGFFIITERATGKVHKTFQLGIRLSEPFSNEIPE